jgi:hypothetical protein
MSRKWRYSRGLVWWPKEITSTFLPRKSQHTIHLTIHLAQSKLRNLKDIPNRLIYQSLGAAKHSSPVNAEAVIRLCGKQTQVFAVKKQGKYVT